jgi:hypothetical protein
MRKTGAFFIITSVIITGSLRADEGMWLLPLLEKINMPVMREMGFELTADQIYSINNTSIKDAVVIFGSGCTGEIVSDEGLIFTNHHCGFDYIQDLSTVENDYLTDGFWAKSRSEEKPCPGLEVKFLERIEDVSARVLSGINDSLSVDERKAVLNDTIKAIEKFACQDDKFKAEVVSFFSDNAYYLFVYTVYSDVRMVGTPPSSIGRFGYEADNWIWPRHNGDFCVFRVYSATDGTPAAYSAENIPLKPRYFFPVSLNGISNGDPSLVLGYPGNTDRYITSSGVKQVRDITNANRIKFRTARQEILAKDMKADPQVNIQYADKYSISSNFWKFSIGQNRSIDALDISGRKKTEEREFQKWVESDSSRLEKYADIIQEIDDYYRNKSTNELNFSAINEAFFVSTELTELIGEFQYLYLLMQSDYYADLQKQEIESLRILVKEFFKNYNVQTDIKVAKSMFRLYGEFIPADLQPELYSRMIKRKYKGDIDKFVNKVYSKTFFLDSVKILNFLDNPRSSVLKSDLGFKVTSSIFRKYVEDYSAISNYNLELEKLERLYMKGRMEMYPDSNFYPDANFTMRLSYGKVKDYAAGDAVHYDEITTLKGVMEKENRDDPEFTVPEKLKELYISKEFGRYGKNGIMPVCFITDNDITGGSSGSPVLNIRGELIGIAFDGNWEALSSAFEPELQRCICVDIRYVLFIIDKFAGCTHLIDELKIVP